MWLLVKEADGLLLIGGKWDFALLMVKFSCSGGARLRSLETCTFLGKWVKVLNYKTWLESKDFNFCPMKENFSANHKWQQVFREDENWKGSHLRRFHRFEGKTQESHSGMRDIKIWRRPDKFFRKWSLQQRLSGEGLLTWLEPKAEEEDMEKFSNLYFASTFTTAKSRYCSQREGSKSVFSTAFPSSNFYGLSARMKKDFLLLFILVKL